MTNSQRFTLKRVTKWTMKLASLNDYRNWSLLLAVLEEISDGTDFSQETFNPSWSSYIYRKATDAATSPLQCGAICIFDTGPCNIAIADVITQACYLGDWYVNSTEFTSVSITGGVSYRKRKLNYLRVVPENCSLLKRMGKRRRKTKKK